MAKVGTMSQYSSQPRTMSEALVSDHEKRVENEIKQLLIDIQRIQPQGEPYCAFGDLFCDPAVEQFYEALVGTLKSAKKRGLIMFKGQFLLKGMHDQVNVSIVGKGGNGNGNGNNDKLSSSCSPTDNDGVGAGSGSGSMNTKGNYASGGSTSNARNQLQRRWKPKTNSNSNGYSSGNSNLSSKQTSEIIHTQNITKISSVSDANSNSGDTNTVNKSKVDGDSDDDQIEDVHTPLKQYNSPLPKSSPRRQLRPGNGKPKFKLDAKLSKETPDLGSNRKMSDDESYQSYATAPTPTTFRSPSFNSAKTPKPKIDVIHSKAVGTTFQSHSLAETHLERVEREVKQLLMDIRRIEPVEDPFCAFGDLFVDERVEQYYEALIGTLKAAKRKGLIKFKGQMLFKGMHDHVQIDIVE